MNNTKVNSLTQLIGYYNSDDEDDEEDDSQNGDEVSNIDANGKIIKSTEWTTCYAKDSGHPYYWNTRTREVTWNMPEEYGNYLEHIRNNYNLDNIESNIQNWIECPSEDNKESYYVNKITRIVSWDKPVGWVAPVTTVSLPSTSINKTSSKSKVACQTKPKFKGNSEIDEKIELINYYAEKTDSSSDDEPTKPKAHLIPSVAAVVEPELESFGLPTKLSQKIYSLKHDLHPDSLKVSPLNQNVSNSEEIKSILLASSTIGEHDDITSSTKNEATNRDSGTPPSTILNDNTETELFDAKLFKRKKRIEFLPKNKEPQGITTVHSNSHEGIETNTINSDTDNSGDLPNNKDGAVPGSTSLYSNFIKGNVEFKGAENADGSKDNMTNDKINIDLELRMNIKDLSEIMKDKLKFLSESTSPATSAQIMFIQFDTLMTAYESQNLNEIYLLKWLKETNATLEKLEKEAVPDDWKCEWDRSSSRYFYENLLTGKKQWDFPVDDISPPNDEKMGGVIGVTVSEKLHNGNDEMDICTTPPPPAECEINNIPLNEDIGCNGAVESTIPKTPPPPVISENPSDVLGSELESFYSDLASIDQVASNNNSNDGTNSSTTPVLEVHSTTPTKSKREASNTDATGPVKKKSKKLKVAGISTKMKDISGMVAKWQKVQRDLSN